MRYSLHIAQAAALTTLLASGCTLQAEGTGPLPTAGDQNVADGGTPSDDPPEDGGTKPIDRGPSCSVDIDLESAVGEKVAEGSTAVRGDRATPRCAYRSEAPDVGYRWTAPSDAVFAIDTLGSNFDTVLHVYRGDCDGRALACNDQIEKTTRASRVRLELTEGTEIVIVIDGYRKAQGNYVLNIFEEPAMAEKGLCDDGFDNDRDGNRDCDDIECRDDPVCI